MHLFTILFVCLTAVPVASLSSLQTPSRGTPGSLSNVSRRGWMRQALVAVSSGSILTAGTTVLSRAPAHAYERRDVGGQ